MSTPRDKRLKDFRGLRERAIRKPENFGAFLGELHQFLYDLYEAATRADDNEDGFQQAIAELCARRKIDCWEDFISPDQQRQFFKDGSDPAAQRIIAFWSELDEPLAF